MDTKSTGNSVMLIIKILILSDKMLPKQGNAEHNFVLTIHFKSAFFHEGNLLS